MMAHPRMTKSDRTTTTTATTGCRRGGMCGSHGGNSQIGWIDRDVEGGTTTEGEEEDDGAGRGSRPVYLDAWVPLAWMDEERCEECAVAKWEAVMHTIVEGWGEGDEEGHGGCRT